MRGGPRSHEPGLGSLKHSFVLRLGGTSILIRNNNPAACVEAALHPDTCDSRLRCAQRDVVAEEQKMPASAGGLCPEGGARASARAFLAVLLDRTY